MKINFRTFAVFFAALLVAIALSIISFTPNTLAASRHSDYDGGGQKSQVSALGGNQGCSFYATTGVVDFNVAMPTRDGEISFGVTKQYLPPIGRKTLSETINYKGLNRQRPEQPPNRV